LAFAADFAGAAGFAFAAGLPLATGLALAGAAFLVAGRLLLAADFLAAGFLAADVLAGAFSGLILGSGYVSASAASDRPSGWNNDSKAKGFARAVQGPRSGRL
jgi:hypothetical protein